MIINQGLQSRTVKLVTSNKKMLERGGGGVLPYMRYIGVCSPKGYVFSAVLFINKVLILADFGHLGHKKSIVLFINTVLILADFGHLGHKEYSFYPLALIW